MMQIEINGKSHNKNWLLTTHAGQETLKQAKNGVRPRCLCTPTGADMYIASRGSLHYLCRMPNTADQHTENCVSHVVPSKLYSLDTAQSILSAILDAIKESGALKWGELRLAILAASQHILFDKEANKIGEKLFSRLFVPEIFNKAQATEQRNLFDQFIAAGESEDTTKRRWLVAPVKDILPSKYGAKVEIKHLPGVKFWVNHDLASKLLTASKSPNVIGLFDIKPSRSGVSILDAALHIWEPNNKNPITPSVDIPTGLPQPSSESEEDRFAHVISIFSLPPSTPRRDIINTMIDFCIKHKK